MNYLIAHLHFCNAALHDSFEYKIDTIHLMYTGGLRQLHLLKVVKSNGAMPFEKEFQAQVK